MNVVCASDPGFVPHLATMLLSLAENNRHDHLRVFVLSDGKLAGEDQIRKMLEGHAVDLAFLPIEGDVFDDLPPAITHVSRTTYARLLMDRHLPADMDRVLYLDADIIIRGDLRELWEYDLGGNTAGAVRSIPPFANHTTLGLPAESLYFNAGVLLIDLRRWRELSIGPRAIEFARRYPERIQWHDQCALNLMLCGDWMPLDPKWNFQTMEIAVDKDGFFRFESMPRRSREVVRIVHFTSWSKPWQYMNCHPLKPDYLAYRQRTPWPLEKFEDRCPRNIIRRFVHRRLPMLVPVWHIAGGIIGIGPA
jgi:lipopolysaccharide biosynthesis glycosyltransferase